jgi:hypothetical protein
MARETAKGIKKPKQETIDNPEDASPQERANLEGYTGPDGSKGLGYLKQDPSADSSGLSSAADDAGRTEQPEGANTGASPMEHPEDAIPDKE